MAPDTRPWLRAFLLQVQHLCCVGDRCAVGEPESAEEKLSMQKEEEAGCTQLHIQRGRPGFDPWVGKIPGEGSGNPLQYSCLENPMDGGAWRPFAHQAPPSPGLLSFMKSTVNMLIRSNLNIQGPIPAEVPGGGPSLFYPHHLPPGVPLESQRHKFQVSRLESSLSSVPRRQDILSISTYLELTEHFFKAFPFFFFYFLNLFLPLRWGCALLGQTHRGRP